MATEVELEYTYLAKELPKDLANAPSKLIIDVYYPAEVAHPALRIRQSGDTYELTKKENASGTDSSYKLEHTVVLDRNEFEALTKAPGRRVAKRRYYYEYKGHTAEIDVFQEDLKGLVEVDFEFKTREEQYAFTMPDFCLADVTQEAFAAGGMLAGKTYKDIEKKLAEYNYKPLSIEAAA